MCVDGEAHHRVEGLAAKLDGTLHIFFSYVIGKGDLNLFSVVIQSRQHRFQRLIHRGAQGFFFYLFHGWGEAVPDHHRWISLLIPSSGHALPNSFFSIHQHRWQELRGDRLQHRR